MMNAPKTLDQQRAEDAWKVVEKVQRDLDKNDQKDFGTQAKKLPTRIMAAGLGQALAFLLAKTQGEGRKKPGMSELLLALSNWLSARRPLTPGEDDRLLVRWLKGNADFQRYATAECLAYLVWLVRFADAAGLTDGQED
jgi:CRISPR-associated protein Cmr5